MATAEQIKSLLKSHADKDDARFYAIAMQVAANEAQKGNRVFADEIRQMIDRARAKTASAQLVPISSPSGELEDLLIMSMPQLRLNDMILAEGLKKTLDRILKEQRHVNTIKEHGLDPRRKLLLSGPPGCGKTMTASVLAGELGLPLFTVRLDGLITKFLGETASKLRLIFESVSKNRAVYLFDEFDAIGSKRGMVHDVGEMRRIVNSFLMLIENNVGSSIIVAATNDASSLDPALFRRFDSLLNLPAPSESLIVQTLRTRLSSTRTVRLAYTKIAKAAYGLSYAEVCRICDEAIKDMLLSGETQMLTSRVLGALEERRAFLSEKNNLR